MKWITPPFVKSKGTEPTIGVFGAGSLGRALALTGRNLRDLGIALQSQAVDWIRESLTHFAAITEDDSVFIKAIEVTDAAARASVS